MQYYKILDAKISFLFKSGGVNFVVFGADSVI